MDFQTFGSADFITEHLFASSFANTFLELFTYNIPVLPEKLQIALQKFEKEIESEHFSLRLLFKELRNICANSDKPIVLLIDEVDSAANNQL